MASSAAPRLDPVGRLRLPRRPTLLRALLVAVLLLTAAGVLYAGADPARPAPASAPRPSPDPDSGPGAGAGAPPGRPPPATPGNSPELPAGTAAGSPGPDRLPIPAGQVGVPVPLGDPGRLAVLHAGDRVDLLAVPTTGGDPVLLATGALVLAVEPAAATLLLAATPAQARQVLSVPPATTFAVVIRG